MERGVVKRWAWLAGVWLMLSLGVFSSTASPPERPSPTFLTVTNSLAATGNVTSRRMSFESNTAATNTLIFPVSYPSIMLDVDSPTQSDVRMPMTEVRVMTHRESVPPMWASDEVRGIRKKFRG